ncbi:MAG: glycosyltransferase [Betaproteobacteria bacterium]|jgi:hypothetical protein|nr:glycosyltransferase [Betaproteobacteria bacterium]
MPGSLILHYIVTRFNVREDAAKKSALDPEWLARRFDLFERFCLPTVMSQTSRDFIWLLLFDVDTPPSARRRIEKLAEWPLIKPLFLEPGTSDVGRVAVEMAMVGTPDLLLTTRLDNDDGLASNYVEVVRNRGMVEEPTVLEFPVGYVWWRGHAYRDRQPRNPFITLAEPLYGDPSRPFVTVYKEAHHESFKMGRVLEVSEDPGWLQVVHGGNIANRARGVRAAVKELKGRFALSDEMIERQENAVMLRLDAMRTRAIEGARRARRRIR